MRAVTAVVALAVAVMGCAGPASGGTGQTSGQSPQSTRSGAAASAAAGATSPSIQHGATPGHPTDGVGGGGPASGQGTGTGPPGAPAQSAFQPPRKGSYVYELSGARQIPGAPGGDYTAGARLTVDVATGASPCSGSQRSAHTTTNEDPAVDSFGCTEWQPAYVALDFSELRITTLGDWKCTYAPPPQTLHNPIKAETFAAQSWSSGNCSGNAQVTVTGQEHVAAAGKTWSVWKITSHADSKMTDDYGNTLTGVADGTAWFSPDLGAAVKTDTTTSGKLNGQPIGSHQVTLLLSSP